MNSSPSSKNKSTKGKPASKIRKDELEKALRMNLLRRKAANKEKRSAE
jgi:hypothetical protein